MPRDFVRLFRERQYDKVLEMANEALSQNVENDVALVFKARSSAHLNRFAEAADSFAAAARLAGLRYSKEKMLHLARNCRLISSFSRSYANLSSESTDSPLQWYESTIQQHLAKSDTHSPLEPLLPGTDYVLGPQHVLDRFGHLDLNAAITLSRKVYPYPLSQADWEGYLYHKDQTIRLPFGDQNLSQSLRTYSQGRAPVPIAPFPTANWPIPCGVHRPQPDCDVLVGDSLVHPATHAMLRWALDGLAARTQDFPVPMYQNIIDPNLTAVEDEQGAGLLWTATDFIISEEEAPPDPRLAAALQACALRMVRRSLPPAAVRRILHQPPRPRARAASPISNLEPAAHRELYAAVEDVLTAALPLLGALRRPGLLLPGRLQAVVKAQRIYLEPGEEYAGVWHTDGLREDVLAVVLFYYRVAPTLSGGDLEFAARRPRAAPLWSDGMHSLEEVTARLSVGDVRGFLDELPRARVPVREGSMAVFSNYQLVHRVLRLSCAAAGGGGVGGGNAESGIVTGDACREADGDGRDRAAAAAVPASRDFLALFVVDQRAPLPSTRDRPAGTAGEVDDMTRWALLQEQLRPAGQFGVDQERVYSTGNGSVALLGWMEAAAAGRAATVPPPPRAEGLAVLGALGAPPPLGRGVSWALEPESWLETGPGPGGPWA